MAFILDNFPINEPIGVLAPETIYAAIFILLVSTRAKSLVNDFGQHLMLNLRYNNKLISANPIIIFNHNEYTWDWKFLLKQLL